ncbi:cytochrome P450 [Marimonas arenosa]|uniref:Cytochrome P450 n=1 Tax=Marimonas arenosa TaxID=1795305 RepID=A0AAE3WB65_9RHOB|nr:cytochrome P450 [Marimonas arenosa]MDQ2088408.1 cytochrome P450 [Marimonas arenosa]
MPIQPLIHGHKPILPPTGVPVWDVDPYDEAVLKNPVPFFNALREKGPFAYLPRYAMLICGGYDVTREVFSDHDRFASSRGVGLSDFALEEPWRPPSIVLEVDPPYHTKTRRVIMRALSPKVVASLRTAFRDDAEHLIDTLAHGREIEAVADLAEAFPTKVFPQAVGIRTPDPRKLIDYASMVFNAIGPDNALRRRALAMAPDIVPWINAQCTRDSLTGDGIGATIHAAAECGEISADEAGMLVRSLLSAGVDTTVSGIGNALVCLAQNPDQFDLLKQDPDALALPAFEETLRYTSPVQAFCRTAGVATQVSGIAIEEGTKILCVLGAANRDPTRWEDPDRFDISRKTAGHLALGAGIHACVGQNIGRAEGQAILRALAQRVERIELTGPPEWRPNNAIHALARLPLRLVPRS